MVQEPDLLPGSMQCTELYIWNQHWRLPSTIHLLQVFQKWSHSSCYSWYWGWGILESNLVSSPCCLPCLKCTEILWFQHPCNLSTFFGKTVGMRDKNHIFARCKIRIVEEKPKKFNLHDTTIIWYKFNICTCEKDTWPVLSKGHFWPSLFIPIKLWN